MTAKRDPPKPPNGRPTGERVIALVAGPSGTGKSYFVACLPNALIYDTDIGGGLGYADELIRQNGSKRIGPGGLNRGTEDEIQIAEYPDLLADLQKRERRGELATITTLVIDHLTVLHDNAVLRLNPKMDRDYGRSNDLATKEWKKVREFCRRKDFNIVCVAHVKGKWEKEEQVGMQAAGPKEIAGDMNIELHLRRAASGGYPSLAAVQKWRRLPTDPRGAVPTVFPFTFEKFSEIEGTQAFSRDREPVALANEEQVRELNGLLEVAKLPEGEVARWLKKAGVESFAEMAADDVQKCIAYVRGLLRSATHQSTNQTADQPATTMTAVEKGA